MDPLRALLACLALCLLPALAQEEAGSPPARPLAANLAGAVQALQRQHGKRWGHLAFEDLRKRVDAHAQRLIHSRVKRGSSSKVSACLAIPVAQRLPHGV